MASLTDVSVDTRSLLITHDEFTELCCRVDLRLGYMLSTKALVLSEHLCVQRLGGRSVLQPHRH